MAAILFTACAGSPIVSSPTATGPVLVNLDPRCRGAKLQPNRTVQHIAVYRWRKSGSGYIPEPTGLDGSLAIDAKFNPQQPPMDHWVLVTFNSRGQALLDPLSTAAAAATHAGIPGSLSPDSPDGQLAVFVGLTDDQVANWDDPIGRGVRQSASTKTSDQQRWPCLCR